MVNFTRRQWITLAVFCAAQFCSALCVSIQAPFFPAEAEKKGATPSQYGFVFGIYELVMFLCSPIYGHYLNTLGVKLVNNTGIFSLSVTCILFGFLESIQDTNTFIAFAFAIRIIEATGTSAFITAAFSIVAKEFPSNVGSAFATLETFFGLGLILGPTVGGALFELGGFKLPFFVVGSLLMVAAFIILYLLPGQDDTADTSGNTQGIISLIRNPAIFISAATVFGGSFSIGFVQATLEPHLRPLKLTPIQLGLVFVLNGATYAISAPIWGYLCDRHLLPQTVYAVGAILITSAFMFIGPAPYLPLRTTLPLIMVSLVVHGLGMGSELVATFTGLHKDSIALGFPNDIGTYGLVSGLWTSVFALGAFLGPSLAGLLFDSIGFSWATQTVVGMHSFLFIATFIYICFFRKTSLENVSERTEVSERDQFITRTMVHRRSYGSLGSREVC